jgi:hypothetical protein
MNSNPRHLSSILLALAAAAPAFAQATQTLDWYLEPNPPSHYGSALCAFPGVGTVLYGGGDRVVVDSTWVWNDGWRRLEPTHRPAPRTRAGLAYDSLRGRLVLFGGRNRTAMFGDTWVFDGSDWAQLSPLTPPPPRYSADLVYDASRDRIVMRGGAIFLQGITTAELWEFDGLAWTQPTQTGDVPPAGGFYCYDAARSETLSMHGGVLRAWNGTTWSLRSIAGLPPVNGRLVYDPATTRVLMPDPYAGSSRAGGIHAYDGQSWTTISTAVLPSTQGMQLVIDPSGGVILGWQEPDPSFSARLCATWSFDGTAWGLRQDGLPPPRAQAAMAYDSLRQRLILHGGLEFTSTLDDLMELDGSTWRVLQPLMGPGPEAYGHHLVYDEARSTLLIFLDEYYSNTLGQWTGGGWTYPSLSLRPPVRSGVAICYDRLRARTLVFGGQSTSGLRNDLWAWNGVEWSELAPATSPPARHSASATYDAPRDRVVLFGGTNGTVPFADTWEFDGTGWIPCNPAVAPPPRSGHLQVFDPARAFTVVFGGSDGSSGLRDTWTWDGTSWTQLQTTRAPDVGIGVSGAYDPRHQELVVFGGSDSHGELWRLGDPTLAAVSSRGQGCDLGRGDLRLATQDEMRIDHTIHLQVDRLPTHFALLASAWVGFQDQQWNGIPLPVSLANVGAPTCFVWADTVTPFWLVNRADGSATTTITIPNAPQFVGVSLYLQAVAWDLTNGSIGTANALQGRIGGS